MKFGLNKWFSNYGTLNMDTELAESHVSRVKEEAIATLRGGDKIQSATCGSFREEHAVSLVSQLLVQQRTQQLCWDGGNHIPQQ